MKGERAALQEAVDLLALWFGRFTGGVAGTPDDMVVRTTTLLAKHGKPRPSVIRNRKLADRPDASEVAPGTLFDATDASLYESDGCNWAVRIRRV